jgi:hypothetical protein
MSNIIYAGLRNPQRDQQIHDALVENSAAEVAEQFNLSKSTVKAAQKRISELCIFDLALSDGYGKKIPVGKVAAKSFRRSALGAYRHFYGTFRNLELNQWIVSDGNQQISIQDLRDLDSGMASVKDDE